MESLKVSNLCKTYIVNKRQNNVLRNVNLEIKSGEMVAVMGPSGSGKTTLLYTVSGMDEASAGKVDFFGKELTNLKANEMSDLRLQEMGFVFMQMYMLKNLQFMIILYYQHIRRLMIIRHLHVMKSKSVRKC